MLLKLYKLKNYAAITTDYALTAALAAGSMALGQPWVLGASAVICCGLFAAAIAYRKHYFENKLVKYPDIHRYSPHLGEIADELYKKSGLKTDNHPIYSFESKEDRAGKTDKLMTQIHNAAAVNLGKPVIMISEPLLKLLTDEEEKAVLAHEFAHAAARHQHVMLPQNFIGTSVRVNNTITKIYTLVAGGWPAVAGAIVTALVSDRILKKIFGKAAFLSVQDDDLSLPDLHKKKKVKKRISLVATIATAAVVSYFVPAYLPIFAAVQGMSIVNTLISKHLSRSSEYQADTGSVELGGDPLAMITALRKITIVMERSRDAVFDGKLHKPGKLTKTWNKLNATHPDLEGRIKNMSRIARKKGVPEEKIKEAAEAPLSISNDNDIPYSVIRDMMGM